MDKTVDKCYTNIISLKRTFDMLKKKMIWSKRNSEIIKKNNALYDSIEENTKEDLELLITYYSERLESVVSFFKLISVSLIIAFIVAMSKTYFPLLNSLIYNYNDISKLSTYNDIIIVSFWIINIMYLVTLLLILTFINFKKTQIRDLTLYIFLLKKKKESLYDK